MGAGSGFIIDPSGLIVTNNHVVGHADKIVVSLTNGTRLPARGDRHRRTDRRGADQGAGDRAAAGAWRSATRRKVEVGDWVLAAGNPFGLGGSVTAGIVSARGRDLGAGPFDNFLQLDAPINPGNSGGPIFNMDGQVVGASARRSSRPPVARSASASPRPASWSCRSSTSCAAAATSSAAGSAYRCEDLERRGHHRRYRAHEPGRACRPAPGRHDPGGQRRAHRDARAG